MECILINKDDPVLISKVFAEITSSDNAADPAAEYNYPFTLYRHKRIYKNLSIKSSYCPHQNLIRCALWMKYTISVYFDDVCVKLLLSAKLIFMSDFCMIEQSISRK